MEKNLFDEEEKVKQISANKSCTEILEASYKSKVNNFENEYNYCTPMKKERNPYTPTTPKKEDRTRHFGDCPIKGKNLTIIFESM